MALTKRENEILNFFQQLDSETETHLHFHDNLKVIANSLGIYIANNTIDLKGEETKLLDMLLDSIKRDIEDFYYFIKADRANERNVR